MQWELFYTLGFLGPLWITPTLKRTLGYKMKLCVRFIRTYSDRVGRFLSHKSVSFHFAHSVRSVQFFVSFYCLLKFPLPWFNVIWNWISNINWIYMQRIVNVIIHCVFQVKNKKTYLIFNPGLIERKRQKGTELHSSTSSSIHQIDCMTQFWTWIDYVSFAVCKWMNYNVLAIVLSISVSFSNCSDGRE